MVEVDKYKLFLKVIILGIFIGLLVVFQSGGPFASVTAAQSLTITVQAQPGAPIGISSIILNSPDPLEPEFTYLVSNKSQKNIDAYAIRYVVASGGQLAEAVELRVGDSPDTVLTPGQVEWGTFTGQTSSQPVRSIELIVDFVRFSDGTTYGRDKHKSAEQLNGHRAGVRAEADRLIEIRTKKGLEAVLSAITSADGGASAPSGQTPQWEEGFRVGIATLRGRLKRAQQEGGTIKVEELLRKSSSSERRGN